MRIALVQDHLRQGGTETQTVALAGAFAALGHAVLLVTFRPGGPLAGRIPEAVHHLALQRRDLGLDFHAPGLVGALRRFEPGVVQLMGRSAHLHGWRIRRAFPDTPLVATFRTGRSVPWPYRRVLRQAAAVIANSEAAARRLVAGLGVDPARIRVIHNGIAAPQPTPGTAVREAVRASLGTPPSSLVLLCVAMLRPGKGHRGLIEAAAELTGEPPWELWLAGDGTERAACEREARRRGLAGRVRFLGRRADTLHLYAAADLAVLASRSESMPNFLVEAQWHGLPVVACDTAGVGETFLPGRSGLLVPPGDIRLFAEAVATLAGDAPRRAAMAAAARAHARSAFDPGRQVDRHLELYARLAAG